VKIWRILSISLLVLVLVVLTACGGGDPEVQRQMVEVTRGDIFQSITAEGTLSLPWHRELTFGTTGTVTEINITEGDSVTKGQELARLDVAALELAVRSAEIDLETASNSFQQLITPYPFRTFEFVLNECLDDVRIAKNMIKETQQELALGLEGESYDMAEMKDILRVANEVLTEAESKLNAGLGEGVNSGNSYWTLRAAQIAVDKAQIALDQASLNLDYAVIVAPFDGVVSKVNAKEGDKLSSMNYATATIIEVIDPTIIELETKVDEIDITSVTVNQKAIIEVDALPALPLEGNVTYIDPVPTEESGVVLYEVTIGFDVPPESGLMSGMSATAEIVMDERTGVLLLPNRAIADDDQGNPVVKVMVDDEIEPRAVVLGMNDGYQTEILAGLHEGDTVVIETAVKSEPSGGFFFGG